MNVARPRMPSAGMVFLWGILGMFASDLAPFALPGGSHFVQAQQQESAAATAPASPEPAAELPHTAFVFDYVLVVVLIAVALYAVCRSSRRV